MSDSLRQFGQTATKLTQNPLGLIALFIVLIYGLAALVLGVGAHGRLEAADIRILVIFLVVFPVLILSCFTYLVIKHPQSLYHPRELPREFRRLLLGQRHRPEALSQAPPQAEEPEARDKVDTRTLRTDEVPYRAEATPQGESGIAGFWQEQVDANHGLNLVHILVPSNEDSKRYDVLIYVGREAGRSLDDVDRVDFFFGPSWGSRVFEGRREKGRFGVATSAHSPFPCVARVTFSDKEESVLLYRYIDFEMGEIIARLRERVVLADVA